MDIINVRQAQKGSSPNPFALVVSADENGQTNVMGVSWWTYGSNNPPTLMVCLGNKSYSNGIIRKTGEFCLCLPDESMIEAAWKCSTTSGRNIDKVKEYDLKVTESKYIKAPILEKSHIAFECKVTQKVELSDHTLFIAEILCIWENAGRKHLYGFNGYSELNVL